MSDTASSISEPPRSWYCDWRVWLLFGLAMALYLPTGMFDTIGLDDPIYVSQNAMVQQGLNGETFVWAWTTKHFGFYHPVTWLSHLLDVSIFGNRPGAFHLVNALIHTLNALLVWAVLTRLTGLQNRCWWIAVIWAIHPLRVESVAWIAERKDVLCGMFSLLSLWFYAGYAKRRNWRDYLGVTVMLGLALLSKPMAVTLPCVMLLLDVWPLKRLGKTAVFEKLSWLIIVMGYAWLTLQFKVDFGETVSAETLPVTYRVMNMFWAYGQYLLMSVFPFGLAVPYLLTNHPIWQVVISAIILLLISSWAVYRFKRQPYLLVGWFWFLGMLFPISGILQTGQQSHADRFTYLPMIGLLLAAVWCLAESPRMALGFQSKWLRGSVVVILMLLSCRQVNFWRNDITLFTHTLAVTGYNPMAHHQLGRAYYNRQQYKFAALHLNATLKHITNDPTIRQQLAQSLIKLGRIDEAIEQLRYLIEQQPNDPTPHLHLAVLLYEQHGPTPQVIKHLQQAISLAPDWDQPRKMLQAIESRIN